MTQFAIDKTLTLDALRFHYRDWNGHGWPTLLLHGLSSTSHTWDLVAPLLSESAHTAALDLRGHGRSDKPDCPYSIDSLADDVLGVLDQLQFEHAVLVGHSLGANVALAAAAREGDRIGGLIMVDGGIVDLSAAPWQQVQNSHTPPSLDDTSADDFRQMIVQRTPQGLLTPAVEAAILASFEIDANNHIHRHLPVEYHMRIVRALWEQKVSELYDKVVSPTLLIIPKSAHDSAALMAQKEKGAEAAERLIADVEVMWLDDTSHDVPLHRPHRLAEAIKLFIKERL
jgi:pimeloyl-ACP methyl ester carboxylesterase